jgi:hypothetical protein
MVIVKAIVLQLVLILITMGFILMNPTHNIENGIKINDNNHIDSYGLTSNQKEMAINKALNNESIKELIKKYKNNVYINNVTLSDLSERSGFIGTDVYAVVPIQFGEKGLPNMENILVYVDLSSNKIIGIEYFSFRPFPMSADIIIPPKSYWYHQLYGVYNYEPMNATVMYFSLNITDNGKVYPIILSKDNFEKLRNGSDYNALEYVDYNTNNTRIQDGNEPVSALWSANISISHHLPLKGKYFQPTYYYVVLINKDTRDIELEFIIS